MPVFLGPYCCGTVDHGDGIASLEIPCSCPFYLATVQPCITQAISGNEPFNQSSVHIWSLFHIQLLHITHIRADAYSYSEQNRNFRRKLLRKY